MAFGATLTLPTIAGGTHNDFRVLLKTADFPTAAIDGGTNSIATGGGSLRAYLDDTKVTALPLDVITFVTGGTPDILVRVRLPSVATGDTIYVEDDDVATSQPVFTNAIGRNNVYPTATFANNSEEVDVVDSSGNHTDGTATANVTNVAGLFGRANFFNNVDTSIEIAGNLDLPGDFTQSIWFSTADINSGFQGAIGDWGASGSENDSYLGIRQGGVFNWDSFASSSNQRSGIVQDEWQRWTVARTGTTVTISKNGVAQGATITDSSGSSTGNTNIYIGALDAGASNWFDGEIGHIELKTDNSTADYLLTEYDNQSSVSAWVTVGTWEDQSSGITITGATTNYSYTAQNSTVELSGEVSIAASVTNYDYTSQDLVIDLTGEVTISASTTNYSYTAQDASITTTATVSIDASLTNYLYTAENAGIELVGAIGIELEVTNYSYTAEPVDISLQGQITLTASATNYTYNVLNATIIIQGPITINPKNIIRVSRKSNTIRVKRNSNIIRVR